MGYTSVFNMTLDSYLAFLITQETVQIVAGLLAVLLVIIIIMRRKSRKKAAEDEF